MSHQAKHCRIDYIELTSTDIDRTKAFYGGAFDWEFQDWGADYISFDGGGFQRVDEVRTGGPLVVIYALDLEAMQARVEGVGGAITRPIFRFPGGRRFHFTDPDGHELAVWSDR